jgi:uncharacterized protein YfaT (DUF1175 family)
MVLFFLSEILQYHCGKSAVDDAEITKVEFQNLMTLFVKQFKEKVENV